MAKQIIHFKFLFISAAIFVVVLLFFTLFYFISLFFNELGCHKDVADKYNNMVKGINQRIDYIVDESSARAIQVRVNIGNNATLNSVLGLAKTEYKDNNNILYKKMTRGRLFTTRTQ